jgi:HD-like signal output (HDOD) protein
MKPSIVFVDDESNVLSGLKRMLYPMQDEWDMSFCLTARHALKVMEGKRPDILVTDLVMPDMDGTQLLEQVCAKYPGVIRIVLSGHSDKRLGIKAARFAHQFLPKPFQADELKKAIKRILSLRVVFTSSEVQTMAAKMDTFPSLPKVHQQIMQELQSSNPSINSVADLISQDLGLSASVMKMVNSAFFGLRTKVSSPLHAVNLLGLDIISALALSAHLFTSFDMTQFPGFDLDRLWQHCLATGMFSKSIARAEGLGTRDQDDFYISGILHDIGKLTMLAYGQGFYKNVVAMSQKENISIWRAEQNALGSSHAELGGYLLSLWGMDEEIVLSVYYHHNLEKFAGDAPLAASALHAANCFEHELTEINPGYALHPLDMEAASRLGYAERVPAWKQACENALKEVREHGSEDSDS